MVFKLKTKASKDGQKCPISIKATNSRGYIAPGQKFAVPVALVDEVISRLGVAGDLRTVTTFQVRGSC
jgi:hypothetical protein